MNIDITKEVEFQGIDGDHLELTKCVCGAKFPPWDFQLTTDMDNPHTCWNCGRKLFFQLTIRVYEIKDQT